MLNVIQVDGPEQIAQARELFLEYAEWLGFSLCFQGFDQELASLPGVYAPPSGRLLLAFADSQLAGCVALRAFSPADAGASGIGEMKRLYVRPAFRGKHIGQRLVERIIEEAKAIGYSRLRLDTIADRMQTAVALYRGHGFREIDKYCENPATSVLYMELELHT